MQRSPPLHPLPRGKASDVPRFGALLAFNRRNRHAPQCALDQRQAHIEKGALAPKHHADGSYVLQPVDFAFQSFLHCCPRRRTVCFAYEAAGLWPVPPPSPPAPLARLLDSLTSLSRFHLTATAPNCRRTFRFAYEAAGLRPAPLPAPPSPLARLFGSLSRQPSIQKDSANDRGFPEEDVSFLRSLSGNLTKLGFTLPDKA